MADETLENNVDNEEAVDESYGTPEIDSKYRLILLAAQRSKQLQRGALSRSEIDTRKHKPTRVALREIEDGLVKYKIDEDEDTDQ